MMVIKERYFSPLEDISLEELVPEDNFYRRLESAVDLSFVRELVKDRYAASGRSSGASFESLLAANEGVFQHAGSFLIHMKI